MKQDFSHVTPPEGARIIPLTQSKYALVDEEDYERVNQYHWHASKSNGGFYAKHKSTFISLGMHRFIMGVTDPKIQVDHIFHNTLDNRKQNLRVCTNKQNIRNSSPIHKTSKYKGVCWNKRTSKWECAIMVDYKSIFLGLFDNEEDAARAYDTKAKELHKEFAYLNFPL